MAGKLPGMSYEDMYELIYASKPAAAKMFSVELLIAIFWEESLFNNIEQEGGTAWGFGQCEPAEYYKLERPRTANDGRTNSPAEHGYLVEGLPARAKIGKRTRLMGSLTPEQAVQVSAGLLCHYYYTKKPTVLGALYAYAGVGYGGDDVPKRLATPGTREAIVQGWLDAEAHLQRRWIPPKPDKKSKKPPTLDLPDFDSDYPTFVKKGLRKARPFDLKDKAFDDRLFPKDPVTGQWRPMRTPGWLTDYMKNV